MKKTLFAVKIKAGRTVREVVVLIGGLVAFALIILAMFALQYRLCQRDHPGRSVSACIHRTEG